VLVVVVVLDPSGVWKQGIEDEDDDEDD